MGNIKAEIAQGYAGVWIDPPPPPVPDPWQAFDLNNQQQGAGQIITPTSRAWTAQSEILDVNQADFGRLYLPFSYPFTAVSFTVSTAGNDDPVDIGLYVPEGDNLIRMVSTGPVTGVLNSIGRKLVPMVGTVDADRVYYIGLAMGASAAPPILISAQFGTTRASEIMGAGVGFAEVLTKGSSHPLPPIIVSPSVASEPAQINLVA